MLGCRLPSPAWPDHADRHAVLRRRSARCRRAARPARVRGTAMSSMIIPPCRRGRCRRPASPSPGGPAGGPAAARRPRPRRWPRTPRSAPAAAQTPAIAARSSAARLPVSAAASSSASASVSQPHRPVRLDRPQVRLVEQLQQARREPGRRRWRLTAAPAAAVVGNTATSVSDGVGAGRSATVISVMTPEGALRADEQPGQVVAGDALGGAPAGAQDLAVGEHDLQAEHVLGGHAVLHAAHAARVGGHVAADRRRLPRTRVGRVAQPSCGDGAGQGGVDHAGLHHGEPVDRVDLEDLVHRDRREHHARRRRRWRRRPARCARPAARPARRPAAAALDHRDHLGGRPRAGPPPAGVPERHRSASSRWCPRSRSGSVSTAPRAAPRATASPGQPYPRR